MDSCIASMSPENFVDPKRFINAFKHYAILTLNGHMTIKNKNSPSVAIQD
jgi:hypothetical protein